MKRVPILTIALAAALAGPPGARAQAPDWDAYRDSLRTVTDVPALHRMQGRLPMPGLATTPVPLIERGLIRLRVWELTRDQVDARLAVEVFERGTERFPRDAWLSYGLALAQAGAHESQFASPGGITVGSSLAEVLGRDPASRARRAALRTLELDPSMSEAAVLLADLATEDGRDRDALFEAKAALESAISDGYGSPAVSRALADIETTLGNYGEAEAALAGIAEAEASGLHSRAVAQLLQPGMEAAGAEAYFAAADSLDAGTLDRMHRDVAVIASPVEEAEWTATTDVQARRLWIERFWSSRAAESGVAEAERLAEHYRRLALARREYLRNSRRGVNSNGVLLSDARFETSPFDDRGLVLLKRGLPQRIVHTRIDGVLPNESWVYTESDGSRNDLFHFVAFRGTRDYSLVRDLLQAVDPSLDPIGDKARFDRAVINLIQDRAPYEPRYQAIAARLPNELETLRDVSLVDPAGIREMLTRTTESVDADYRRDARRTLESDTYTARFDRALPFHYDIFTFRAPFGRTDLTAAFAVPAEGVAAVETGDRLVYPLAVSVILMDTLTDEVMRTDTVLRVRPERIIGPGEFVRGYVTLPVVPSEHIVYRMVVRSTPIGAGAVYAGDTDLKDYTGLELQVSDLILATPDGNGGWARGDLTLDVTLPRRFEPDHPFTLFYELYNLEADDPYRTHLEVKSADGGGIFGGIKRLLGFGRPGIDLRFEDRARLSEDGAVRELRDLGTDLPPGRYRMTVTVRNERTGEEAASQTIFEVVG